jgi:hypothetical protein
MGRSVIGLSAFVGMTVGGLVPALWGAGSFSLSSIFLSVVGGVAGVLLGARLADT